MSTAHYQRPETDASEAQVVQLHPQPRPQQGREVAIAYRNDEIVQRISLSAMGVRGIIDVGTEVTGDILATSSMGIRGTLNGSLEVRSDAGLVVVFPGARVSGTIRARFVWLAGNHDGTVECQRLLVLPGGCFTGGSICETLEVKHGGDYLPRTATKQHFNPSP